MDPLAYYSQSIAGHLDLMQRARPVADWLADPATPPALRDRLQLAQRLRDFAVQQLALPDNASYRRYVDLQRPAAVWNVVAAPELSLTLKTWCYPLMGCVGYRGYFKRDDAVAEAAVQRAAGLDATVYGVPAYSTLGWTNWLGGDPLLNTFVNGSEAGLARLVFHELAHQVVYVPGDTMFNESYATAVERLGLLQWRASGRTLAENVAAVQRLADFRAITRRTRADLSALYQPPAGEAFSDAHQRQRKAELLAAMRAEFAALKASETGPWAGFTGYDDWVARANNASLALQAAYDGLVSDFERLFEREGRDFNRFHAAVQRLADMPLDVRRATLQAGP
jgi:predicted aminopeptidase